MAKMSKEELLAKVRAKMKEKSGNRKDVNEFRPPKVEEKKEQELYFRVLPELQKGDVCASGVAEGSCDLWFYPNGNHWFQKEKLECPRVYGVGDCPICNFGFELLEDEDDKQARSTIAKNYLSRAYNAVNVYFEKYDRNPEELRGKVMWFNLPKTVFDIMDACINNDDPGDEMEPKACGLFYDPDESYIFKLHIKHKSGYNNYESSSFLAKSQSPLVALPDGSPDQQKIDQILAQRHYLPSKFPACDIDKLEGMLESMKRHILGDDDDSGKTISVSNTPKKEETPKEEVKETPKEEAKEAPKEEPKKEVKETPKEEPKKETKKDDGDLSGDPEIQALLDKINNE